MANLDETETYEAGIYQIETTDPVIGGEPDLGNLLGIPNVPAQQLANRTKWLKKEVDSLKTQLTLAKLHAVAGYQELPGGLILQWGHVFGPNDTQITFPITFPNNAFGVVVSDVNTDAFVGQAQIVGSRQVALTGFKVTAFDHDGVAATISNGFIYLALGN